MVYLGRFRYGKLIGWCQLKKVSYLYYQWTDGGHHRSWGLEPTGQTRRPPWPPVTWWPLGCMKGSWEPWLLCTRTWRAGWCSVDPRGRGRYQTLRRRNRQMMSPITHRFHFLCVSFRWNGNNYFKFHYCLKKPFPRARGGDQVASVLAFYSNVQSSLKAMLEPYPGWA